MRIALPVAGFVLLILGAIALTANRFIFSTGKAPTVKSFVANPTMIAEGQTAILQWNVSGAKSVSIDQGVGTTSSVGTQTVAPSTSTTYTLSATNSVGLTTSSATITVISKSPPVIASFTASPASITAGQSSTLQWNVKGAASVTIDHDIGHVNSTGSLSVMPVENVTYKIVAVNTAGSATASSTITIAVAGPPVIDDFSLAPHTIDEGKTSTLKWDVMGATSVSIDQGIGTVCSVGMVTVSPSVSTGYTLLATNDSGDTSKTAFVAVIPANQSGLVGGATAVIPTNPSATVQPAAPSWRPT